MRSLLAYRKDLAFGAVCALAGVLLSAGPHFWNWATRGDWTYLSDYDEFRCYLPIVARAYAGNAFRLPDPAVVEDVPNPAYPVLQFGPGIFAAQQLDWGPFGISLAWRIQGGLCMGICWYLLFRILGFSRVGAMACALFMLGDAGILQGKPVYQHATKASYLLSEDGEFRYMEPTIITHWRIITPALSWWALILHVAAFVWSRKQGTTKAAVICGLSVALLPYIYIYYWVAAGLALILGLAVDAGHRKLYWIAGSVGFLGAVPYLIQKICARGDYPRDWMDRADLLTPAGSLPMIYSRVMVGTLLLALPVIWRFRREQLYVWCLAVGSILLTNHHVVTGITLQNEHWWYVTGCICSTLIVVLLATQIQVATTRWPDLHYMVGILVVLHFSIAIWLRTQDTSRSLSALTIAANYQEFQQQRAKYPNPLTAGSGICGDPGFVDFEIILDLLRPMDHYCVLFSPTTMHDQWDAQIALDAVSLSTDRELFQKAQENRLSQGWGPWLHDPALFKARVDNRMAHFDKFSADPNGAFRSFGVRYVALRIDAPLPTYFDSSWRRIQDGPIWNVWERVEP